MEHEFWHERWGDGRIGFHEDRPNTFLARHIAALGTAKKVLVPLCGKAHDLAYLAEHGHTVLGVELSPLAAEAFFAEHDLTPSRDTLGPFERFQSGPVTILVGDFFLLSPELLSAAGGADALYDRAALVALPEAMRRDYVAHLRTLLGGVGGATAGVPALVITFTYAQDLMDGPPFSVTPAELRELYAGLDVSELDSAMTELGRFRQAGGAIERCFSIRL